MPWDRSSFSDQLLCSQTTRYCNEGFSNKPIKPMLPRNLLDSPMFPLIYLPKLKTIKPQDPEISVKSSFNTQLLPSSGRSSLIDPRPTLAQPNSLKIPSSTVLDHRYTSRIPPNSSQYSENPCILKDTSIKPASTPSSKITIGMLLNHEGDKFHLSEYVSQSKKRGDIPILDDLSSPPVAEFFTHSSVESASVPIELPCTTKASDRSPKVTPNICKSDVNWREKIWQAGKAHVCAVAGCEMRFKRLEHLKRHHRVHTMERPFSCPYPECGKTFSRQDNLRQHTRTHQREHTRGKRQRTL